MSGFLDRIVLGYQEWVALPKLHIPIIKAKVDTGATLSTLHAIDIKRVWRHGIPHVKFTVHPFLQDKRIERHCCLPIIDRRTIVSSNGERELRYIVKTFLRLQNKRIEIELTLTDRSTMRFPMLLGRKALVGVAVVDPGKAYYLGKFNTMEAENLYIK
ncbi:MAG: RimK/LysX family protein [Pseudomonadota bacterium]